MGKIFAVFFVIPVICLLLSGCATTQGSVTPRQHKKYYREYNHPSVERANDIQYRSAYKFDTKGKKYLKYYKKQDKKNKKK
jgi:uncharacterized protein YceK